MRRVIYPRVTVDANVWHQSFPRYLILRLHYARTCNVRWSDRICEEFETSLQNSEHGPKLSSQRVGDIKQEFRKALGDYEPLDTPEHQEGIEMLLDSMPADVVRDEDDIHVMYFADWSRSDYLVTQNLRHFTGKVAENFQFTEMSLDDFLCDLLETSPAKFDGALLETLTPMRKKGHSVRKILEDLGKSDKPKKKGKEGGYNCPEISSRLLESVDTIQEAVLRERQKRYGYI